MLNKLRKDESNWEDLADIKQMAKLFKSQRFHQFYNSYFDDATTSDDVDAGPHHYSSLAMVHFVDRLRSSEGLLAFSCRQASVDWFDDYFRITLEDTDRPWDRDHIYPSELTKSKRARGRSEEGLGLVKDWQTTIANIRFWPLELNRSDSSQLPSEKLHYAINKDVFLACKIESEEELFKYSAISHDDSQLWLGLGDNPKEKSQAHAILDALMRRMLSMYQDWYESLGVKELFSA